MIMTFASAKDYGRDAAILIDPLLFLKMEHALFRSQ